MPVVNYNFQGSGAGDVKAGMRAIDDQAKRSASAQDKRSKKLRRNRARARLRRIREAKRLVQAEQRVEQQAEKTKLRDIQKFEQRRWREAKRGQDRLNRQKKNDRMKQLRSAERDAKRQAKAEDRARERGRSRRAGFARGVGRAALGVAGAGAMAITGAVAGVSTAAVRQQFTLEEKSRTLAVQARGAGEKMADPKAITSRAQQVALDVGGTTAESVIDAMSTFVTRTGRFDLAESMSETFATVAKATGSSADEIAGAAADMFEKFDIKSIDDMQQAMATLTFQGKKGAFELSDAASQFPKLAAAASRLGGFQGVKGVRELGGLTQIARSSTGSAEAAATSLEAVFTGLTTKQGALGKAGVEVFDKSGKARDIQSLLTDVISKVGGTDVAKKKEDLSTIFGRQGIRALSPLISAYANATGDAAAKTKAVAAALNDAIDAPGTWNDVVEDAALQNEALSSRMTTAWEGIVAASGDKLAPAIEELVTMFADFAVEGGGIEAMATAFDIVAENAKFLGEVFGEVAATLQDLGLIEGPSAQDTIARETKKQGKLDKRIAAAEGGMDPLLGKILGGTATEKEQARFAALEEKARGLRGEKAESQAKIDAAKKDVEAPLEGARAANLGRATDVPMLTKAEFVKEFTKAGGVRSKTEAAGLVGPLTGVDRAQKEHAEHIADRITRGEQVPTIGFSPGQQELMNELGGQIQAIRGGTVAGADADTAGMGSRRDVVNIVESSAAAMKQIGPAAAAAAKALASIKAVGGADVDG